MARTVKARVWGGRLVLDEPTDLPDGSEVELVVPEESRALLGSEHALEPEPMFKFVEPA